MVIWQLCVGHMELVVVWLRVLLPTQLVKVAHAGMPLILTLHHQSLFLWQTGMSAPILMSREGSAMFAGCYTSVFPIKAMFAKLTFWDLSIWAPGL